MRLALVPSSRPSAHLRDLRAFAVAVLLGMPALAHADGAPIAGTGGGTGEKPQSKIWYADQTWWGILTQSGHGLHFYEFNGTDWVPSTFMDASLHSSGRADVKWNVDTDELFVLAYTKSPKLFKYHYDRNLRVYQLQPGFPVSLPVTSGSETMVLDQDTTGRLWTAWEGGNTIWTAWSTSADHTQWSAPYALRSGVNSDDIASVVAFLDDIGVIWSDQNRDEIAFRMHRDGDPPDLWQPVEVVESGSGFADDHVSIKASTDGTLYAVTKDDNDKMFLHRRTPGGTWSTRSGVISGTGTRPIVMLCDDDARIYVPYTNWSSSTIYIKLRRARYSTRDFSTYVRKFISGATMNNASGTKQVLPSGVFMAVCEGGGHLWWNGWGTVPPDGPPPPEPPVAAAAEILVPPTPPRSDPELVLEMPFDEGFGNTTQDATHRGHLGELLGSIAKSGDAPHWIPGQSGTGLAFDGASYVRIASAPDIEIPGSFTLEAWVRPHAGVIGNGTVLSKGKSNARNYQILLREDRRIDFKWEVPGGSNRGLIGSQALSAGTWHHVACIYDQDAGRSFIYIDGQLDRSTADSGTPVVNDQPLHLGRRISGSTAKEYLDGDLDGIRIWRGVAYHGSFNPGPAPQSRPAPKPHPEVHLAWQPPPGETRALTYSITLHRSGGTFVLAQGLSGTSWTHRFPVYGNLCYEIRATSTEDNRTGEPATACVTLAATTHPRGRFQDPPQPATKAAPALETRLAAAPNPFNPTTRVHLRLQQDGRVRLAVYDVRGRRVALLHDGMLHAGEHRFTWTARDPHQGALGSGVYFLRADLPDRVLQRRLVLLK